MCWCWSTRLQSQLTKKRRDFKLIFLKSLSQAKNIILEEFGENSKSYLKSNIHSEPLPHFGSQTWPTGQKSKIQKFKINALLKFFRPSSSVFLRMRWSTYWISVPHSRYRLNFNYEIPKMNFFPTFFVWFNFKFCNISFINMWNFIGRSGIISSWSLFRS